jgi:hypothetical protein
MHGAQAISRFGRAQPEPPAYAMRRCSLSSAAAEKPLRPSLHDCVDLITQRHILHKDFLNMT